MEKDHDFEWLLTHIPHGKGLKPREELARRVGEVLQRRVDEGLLPYTVGVFGGWGSGKTTFLALLAKQLQKCTNCRIIYFNSWKYAGLMEIVPALIYKILQYGVVDTEDNRQKAAMRVLLSLGKEYSDRFGKWAQERVGINVVDLFKDIHDLANTVTEEGKTVPQKVVNAYYTQVDRAQDQLLDVLGKVESGKKVEHPVVVLVDELDRCDPDEAFNVIKQMRVLFAMRRLPVAFVMCANPEPIGLAIKHRYGLESDSGDYESRRILEKFVDAYEDFTEPASLGDLVLNLWNDPPAPPPPWIMQVDKSNNNTAYASDSVKNANVSDVITTAIPYYANLRVLQKTFHYLKGRAGWNRHLLWTLWHLEIIDQLDPRFRQHLRVLASSIQKIAGQSYRDIEEKVRYSVDGKKLCFLTDKGNTMFSVFRSLFWEHGRNELNRLSQEKDPESKERLLCLQEILSDHRKVDFVVSMCLLPFPELADHATLLKNQQEGQMPPLGKVFGKDLGDEFGWSIARR